MIAVEELKYESEVRAYLSTLKAEIQPENKREVRAILLSRKRELLIAHKSALKTQESRALNLLKRVDYANIEPTLVHVPKSDNELWRYLLCMLSSSPTAAFGKPGRSNRFFAYDLTSHGILGVVEVGSDMQTLGVRDKHIAWSKEMKFSGRLNSIGNIGTCVSTQPFGTLCGGKFMCVACTSELLVDTWQHRYGEVLAAINVTSLYGRSSMYNRLNEFDYLGNTPGLGTAHIDAAGLRLLKAFASANNLKLRSGGHGLSMDNKSDLVERVLATLKIDRTSIESHQPRGVYFHAMGAQALPYLRGEVDTFEPDRRSLRDVRDWWKTRWYTPRFAKYAEEVTSFDPDVYRIDNQIELCRDAV